jgi:hypothetical protein
MKNKRHTRDSQIIQGHTRQARVNRMPFMPPKEDILNMFGIRVEIRVKLGSELSKPWLR